MGVGKEVEEIMPEKNRDYAPIKKYILPAGNLGGEIRVFIPATASKADIEAMAHIMTAVAETWTGLEEES